jgi:short-subunit dehydrogenase involved in D-alanine esterification of teichoic acids
MTIDKYLSKNILITGGTQGLGLSLAKKLITDGANVIVCGRTDEDLQKNKDWETIQTKTKKYID